MQRNLLDIRNPILPNLSPATQDQGVALFGGLISTIINILLIAGTLAFFFLFILGAIRWISSSGDKTHLEQARGTLTNALIGLFIMFSVFAIIKLIEVLFDVNILNINLDVLTIR